MPTALAISPHLDDAVFSAGGTLARLAGQGWRVIVATVFTASVAGPQGFALACQLDKGLSADVDYMALRRAEDAVACAALGAEPVWLPFVEAPHRGYRSAAELFAGMRDDDGIVRNLESALSELIRVHAPDKIFAPQAIGAHVDHVAVVKALRSCRDRVCFWTDYPYAARSSAREGCFADETDDLVEEVIELKPEELSAKTAATAAYATQLGYQFGGASSAIEAIKTDGCVETFKQIQQKF